jgi:two-component system, cell cycle response regulator DivK
LRDDLKYPEFPHYTNSDALYLKGAGFDVLTANDGEHALAEAFRAHPHLIVMDLEMPVLSGYEVAARLRQHEETRQIPLIAATGHSHARQLEDAVRAGFDAVIVKPCDPDELVKQIRSLLEQRRRAGE